MPLTARIRWWHIAAALGLTAALDLYELFVTIPGLAGISPQPIFDMRVGGYGVTEAQALLTALGADGRWYYLSRHVPADTLLAIIEAIAISLIILRVTRPQGRFAIAVPGSGRAVMLAAPAATLFLDVCENALVTHMLIGEAPNAAVVSTASLATQGKWVFASLSIALALIVPPAAWLRGRWRDRSRNPAQSQQPSPR